MLADKVIYFPPNKSRDPLSAQEVFGEDGLLQILSQVGKR
jgi:hypothetical protein